MPSSSILPGESVIMRRLRVLHDSKLLSRWHNGTVWISSQRIRDRVERRGGQVMNSGGDNGRCPERSSLARSGGHDVSFSAVTSTISQLGRRRYRKFCNRLIAFLIWIEPIRDLTRNRSRTRSLEHFARGERDISLTLISVSMRFEKRKQPGGLFSTHENEYMGAVNASRFVLTLPSSLAVTLLLL